MHRSEAAPQTAQEAWLPAEVLSPSQVTQFLHCPAKWYFRYLLDLPEPATAPTALGKAFHEAIAHNFRHKLQTRSDLPLTEALESFRSSLGQHLESAALAGGVDAVEIFDLGTVMLQKYLCEAAPLIQPAAVETAVAGMIGGIKVRGYVDLLDTNGRIIDTKSALKPMKGISHDHKLQLTSYAMITPAASGLCRLDTVTKGRTVSLTQKSFQIGPADRRYAETVYPMVQESIREGIFLPRRSSALCSRKYCGYWRACEREFGGAVRDN
jgi:RecB family exonuclease